MITPNGFLITYNFKSKESSGSFKNIPQLKRSFYTKFNGQPISYATLSGKNQFKNYKDIIQLTDMNYNYYNINISFTNT